MTQPTHDELIAWIDKELTYLDEHDQQWVNVKKNYRASLLANKATLERHREQLVPAQFFPELPARIVCSSCFHSRNIEAMRLK